MKNVVFFIEITILWTSQMYGQRSEEPVNINTYLGKLRSVAGSMDCKDWAEATKQWENIISLNPVNGEFWFKLGESYFYSNQIDKAIGAFKKAASMGAPPSFECTYYLAKCYAKTNNKMAALHWLKKSFDMGYRSLMSAQRDTTFKSYFEAHEFRNITGQPLQDFKNREEGWRFDISLVEREIRRRAPNPYRLVSKQQLTDSFEHLKKRIASLTDLQVTIELMKLLVLVGDGHTMIYAFFERPEFQKNLPIDFYEFEEGVFITDVDRRYKELLGCQIIAFDGKSIEEVKKGIDPIINRDNDYAPKVMGIMRMRTIPLLFGLRLANHPDKVTLTIKDTKGDIKTVTMNADCPVSSRRLWDKLPENWVSYFQMNNIQQPLYLQQRYTHYWFKFLSESSTLYFQYNAVADDPINNFDHFCDSLFAFIDSNRIEKLVIDVRLNNGGNTLLTPYLISKIIACRKINKKGALFGIIGRRTYSAAINLLGYLERFTQITYIGEPTGSSPNFIGEENPFELPFSRLMANVSDQSWQSSWPTDNRKWFTPFMYFPPYFKDFSLGEDPALDVILRYKPN